MRFALLAHALDGLASRALVLTSAAVLAAALLLFAPAVANYHELRVRDRIDLAQTAALALEASPDLSPALERELLENAEVLRIALRRDDVRELLLESDTAPTQAPRTYDYRAAESFARFAWAFETLLAPRGRVLRVVARPRFESGEFIEIVLNEAPLKRELWAFAGRQALSALAIALIAGAFIYALLTWLFVRPIGALTARVERFRDAPEDVTTFAAPSRRVDEIGRADRALADMAGHVRASLRQRAHLAALGSAVARIAHDLRNALGTAQLIADRLGQSQDASVRAAAPRLERALTRAANLASATLQFGKAEEPAPVLAPLKVAEALQEAIEDVFAAFPGLTPPHAPASDLMVMADGDQLHRVLVNIFRNAAQAVVRAARQDAGDAVSVALTRRGERVAITVADRGPGVPENARARLFEPFVSGDRAGGAGLGLAIARELARAQGGDVSLVSTSADGAMFEISLPAA